MKLTKSFEQAVCIFAILCTQKKEIPVASRTITLRMNGSHTYLRKIIRKLVVADLVKSVPGNKGGFSLAKNPAEISVIEVVEAIEGSIDTYQSTGIIPRVFNDVTNEIAESGDSYLHSIFQGADQRWQAELQKVSVLEIVTDVLGEEKVSFIDWNQDADSLATIFHKIRTLREKNKF